MIKKTCVFHKVQVCFFCQLHKVQENMYVRTRETRCLYQRKQIKNESARKVREKILAFSSFLSSFRRARETFFTSFDSPSLSLSLSTTLSFLPRSAASRGFFFLFPRSSFVKRRESCKQLACPPGNIPIKYVLSIVNRWSGVFHRRAVIQCGSINAKPLL